MITLSNLQDITHKSGIYLITNKINGKHYVGQAKDLKKRLSAHYHIFLNGGTERMILYKAISKYGIENFSVTILETLEIYNQRLIDLMEVYYIKLYNSYGEYNQTKGGDGGVLGYKMTEEQKRKISENSKKLALDGRYTLYAYDINNKKAYKFPNAEIASKYLCINRSTITRGLEKKQVKGFLFSRSIENLKTLISLHK